MPRYRQWIVMDTLRGLTLHGPVSPLAFHLTLGKKFTTYVAWFGDQGQFGEGGEADDDDARDKAKEAEQIFRDIQLITRV